jgi:hypothetical protein
MAVTGIFLSLARVPTWGALPYSSASDRQDILFLVWSYHGFPPPVHQAEAAKEELQLAAHKKLTPEGSQFRKDGRPYIAYRGIFTTFREQLWPGTSFPSTRRGSLTEFLRTRPTGG